MFKDFFGTHVMLYYTVIDPKPKFPFEMLLFNLTHRACDQVKNAFKNFYKKIMFNVSVIFWKLKLCRFLKIEIIKIYLIGSKMPIFENEKIWKSLHPTGRWAQLPRHLSCSAATVLYIANEADHYGLRGKLHPNCLTIKSIKRKRFYVYMAPIRQKKRIQYIF